MHSARWSLLVFTRRPLMFDWSAVSDDYRQRDLNDVWMGAAQNRKLKKLSGPFPVFHLSCLALSRSSQCLCWDAIHPSPHSATNGVFVRLLLTSPLLG